MKILNGKGNEFSYIAREIEDKFTTWLTHSKITEEEFDNVLKSELVKIKETCNDGNIEIVLLANNVKVASSILFLGNEEIKIEDFFLEVLLLLSFVAARYERNAFKKEVDDFAKYVDEKYLGNIL